MIVREYGQCTVCGAKLILRVGIGVEASCEHSFDCPICSTPITVEAKTGRPPQAWIDVKENIERIERHKEVASIINLHPAFAFKIEDYHSPTAFASMQAGDLIFPHARIAKNSRFADVATDFEVPNTAKIWSVVRNVLNLATKEDPVGILDQQLSKYVDLRREYRTKFKCETAFKCAASFFDDTFYPAIGKLRSPLRAFAKKQKSEHPDQFFNLLKFYENKLFSENFNKYISTFNDYYRYYDQFRQVLAHARVADEGVDDLIVGSKKFDEIKLYYGQVYEALTSAYVLLATLFNLSEGRNFDTFSAMSLKKYLTDLEKSKRSNPFLGVPELAAFSKHEDSALRNGSHHASIWRNGELVKFKSGGVGAERDMSFGRYMHICNEATIALAALFLVELEFFSKIRIS